MQRNPGLARFFLWPLFSFILLAPMSCRKESQPDIPYIYIDRTLYPNTLDYIPTGGYAYINDGYRGLLIYRLLPDEFKVYERCCPYDPHQSFAVVRVENSGLTCIDTVCGSRYILTDGSPTSGPSAYALRQYKWSYDGEALHIYN